MAEEIAGPQWIPTFLAALAETRQAKRAIKICGMSVTTVYTQRRTNLRFAQAWDAALPPKPARAKVADKPQAERVRSGGWRAPFLEALAETSNITASAIRANVPLRTIYKARRDRCVAAALRAPRDGRAAAHADRRGRRAGDARFDRPVLRGHAPAAPGQYRDPARGGDRR